MNRELVRSSSWDARDRCLLKSKTDQYNGLQGVTYQHILKHGEDINSLVRALPEVLLTRNDELEKTNPKMTVCASAFTTSPPMLNLFKVGPAPIHVSSERSNNICTSAVHHICLP